MILIHLASFSLLLLFLYWRLRLVLRSFLEDRIKRVDDSLKTSVYLKTLLLKAYKAEQEYHANLPYIIKQTELNAKKKVAAYEKQIETKIKDTTKHWLDDFDNYIKKTNYRVVEDIKDEITHKVVVNLIKVMRRDVPAKSLLKEVKKFVHK